MQSPVEAMTPEFLASGDCALTLEFGKAIDADVNARVIALADAIQAVGIDGVTDIVPTYRSLLIRYDPDIVRGRALEQRLAALLRAVEPGKASARRWTIPVLYGGEVGLDLEEMAATKGLTPEALVDLHAGADYRVFMIGFAPGFAYLGGLPESLHTPRLKTPRQNIPAGAIGIGGQQASVNSVAGPSGWRYIGWTPIRTFDPVRPAPFLLRAGDRVRFRPIGEDAAADLARRAEAGETVIAPEETA